MNSITEHKLSRRVKCLKGRDAVISGTFSPLLMNPAMERGLQFAEVTPVNNIILDA